MSRFFAEKLKSLLPYTPGEQPRDMQYIKLNTNESPFPPSPYAVEALNKEQGELLRLYSDPTSATVRNAIAGYYGVGADNVIVSNGSDEILAFAYMAFCESDGFVAPDISYGFYPVFCDVFSLKCETIPLKEDFSVDVEAFCATDKNVILANPNAPTGICLPLSDIEKIAAANPNRLVVIDEAYVDFGGETAVPLTAKYDNLIVVQTFSKSRSLAGARLGFAVANKDLICDLNKVKFSFNPYNVNRLTELAGAKAMQDVAYFEANREKIVKTRAFTVEALGSLGFEILPSKANFILAKHKGISGEELYSELKKRGILVRCLSNERIKEFVRITIGTDEQMAKLISETAKILEAKAL